MSRLAFAVASTLLITGGITAGAIQSAPAKVKLARSYTDGFSQAYTFDMTMSVADSKFRLEGGYTETVKKILDGGAADVEEKITAMKTTFDGEVGPDEELPEPETWPWGPNGVPTKTSEDTDPLEIAMYVGSYLPNREVDLKGTYPIKWEPGDTKFKIEGTGTLIATGRLYEERVAKLEMEATISHPEMGETKVTVTSYVSLDVGKLVRSIGKIKAEQDGETFEAEFELRKVRK
jgi:hypothetical protein